MKFSLKAMLAVALLSATPMVHATAYKQEARASQSFVDCWNRLDGISMERLRQAMTDGSFGTPEAEKRIHHSQAAQERYVARCMQMGFVQGNAPEQEAALLNALLNDNG